MRISIDQLLVSDKARIYDVLIVIDKNGLGIAFVVDDQKILCGVVTDGNIRRILLEGATITDSVILAMITNCVTLPINTQPEIISQHLNERIQVIPLLDQEGRPVDYASHFRYYRIPVMEPSLAGNELNYVLECIKTNWISSQGGFVRRFEKEFAAYTNVSNALAVTNGTAALHLALVALGIGDGDEVIVPDLTFAATINAVLYVGATPVLADVTRDTWTIDPDQVRQLITPKTKAVIPVHLYGQPADMNSIMDLARRHGIYVVEDAAEALGSLYFGKQVGTFGDAAAFSFFGNKLITTGEGGMVTYRHSTLAERAQRLRDHGMDPSRRYWHPEIGYNYRLTNLQAAIGVAQLEQIAGFVQRKIEIGKFYRSHLKAIKELQMPKESEDVRNVYWLFSAIIDTEHLGINRDEFMERLLANGIESRPLFYPLHTMPPYVEYGRGRHFPNANWLSANGISLPSAVNLSDREMEHVCDVIKKIIECRTTLKSAGDRLI